MNFQKLIKVKRRLKKLLVTEITLVTKESKLKPVNNKPLLLIKAKPVGEQVMASKGSTTIVLTDEQVAELKTKQEAELDKDERGTNSHDEKHNEIQLAEIQEKTKELEDRIKANEDLIKKHNLQPVNQPQPRPNPALPLQTAQVIESAGIKIDPAVPPVIPPVVVPVVSQQVQETTVETPAPIETIPAKKSPDLFTEDKEKEKLKNVRTLYGEYKKDATKDPWKFVEQVATL